MSEELELVLEELLKLEFDELLELVFDELLELELALVVSFSPARATRNTFRSTVNACSPVRISVTDADVADTPGAIAVAANAAVPVSAMLAHPASSVDRKAVK